MNTPKHLDNVTVNEAVYLPIMITHSRVCFFTKLRTAGFSKYYLKHKKHNNFSNHTTIEQQVQ